MEARRPEKRLGQASRKDIAGPGPGRGAEDRFRTCSGCKPGSTLMDWAWAMRLQQ